MKPVLHSGSVHEYSAPYSMEYLLRNSGGSHGSSHGSSSHGTSQSGGHGGGHSGGHDTKICGANRSTCHLQIAAKCGTGPKDEPCSSKFTFMLFPFFALFVGVLATPLSRAIRVPYTLTLLISGIVIGLIGCGYELGLLSTSLRQWVHLNPPTAFFYVFLAPLIFEASFNCRWHVFKRLLVPILTAAFVIVILQVFLIAAFQMKVIQSPNWSWWDGLMFGSMLSATDPISVTATLKSLGASEFLNTLIEGESLVNDGSAFVLWEAFFENAKHPGELGVGDIIFSIFRLSVGGMLMGVAFGLGALIILGLVYDEFEVETSLTVIIAFLGFWTAQAPSKLSGVICNVASGLVISAFGRHLITPSVRGPLHEFWELLGWIANTIVFVHSGVLLTAFIWSCAGKPNTWREYVYILVYYLFLQVIRMGLMLLFQPLMKWRNPWLRWREAVVVGFSGLRGAVSLVLALEVAGTRAISDEVRSRVVLWSTGIVALSLLVNGFLVKPLISGLKLDKAEKTREDFMDRARAIMVQRTLMILDSLSIETMFKSARWSYVRSNVLPKEWLEENLHTQGYKHAVEQLMDQRATNRASLEMVRREAQDHLLQSELNRRLSLTGAPGQRTEMSPRASAVRTVNDINAHMVSPRVSAAYRQGGGREHVQFEHGGLDERVLARDSVSSPVDRVQANIRNSITLEPGANRRSIEADLVTYGKKATSKAPTQAKIHEEVAGLYHNLMHGVEIEFTEKDREVRRRLLTSILTHVRSLSNASLVEFNVLHNLEQDIQLALDANEEQREYDLFSFLDNRGRDRGFSLYKLYEQALEGKKLRGETSITTAVIIFGILTEILKEDVLHDSAIVLLQAERLYEGAAALMNRLENMNPYAFEWVQSQFAIYVCQRKQDEVLEDLQASGIVDEQEYNVIKEELIEVRRNHIRSRQSIFYAGKQRLPPRLKPRQLLQDHPLFRELPEHLMSGIVDRYGELVHLTGGQALQCEKGALVVILEGYLRPSDDTPLPFSHPLMVGEDKDNRGSVALEKPEMSRFGNVQTSSGFTPLSSGAMMYWCFGPCNSFCGPAVALLSHSRENGADCDIVHGRANETNFVCCEISNGATVFTLPVLQVKALAQKDEQFRLEITRALAREIVLESVTDQRPYALSHFMESVSNGVDVNTVVGRAYRVLERLPYMTVIPFRPGERSSVTLQGPGVLLNGTVRVSIVDTSGLVGAINLLHEQLTGPALLPAGGLILEEVHNPDDPTQLQEGFEGVDDSQHLMSETAAQASAAASNILDAVDNVRGSTNTPDRNTILAHVLIEESHDSEETALLRLQRWTADDAFVDMHGRFGMVRNVELAPLTEGKII